MNSLITNTAIKPDELSVAHYIDRETGALVEQDIKISWFFSYLYSARTGQLFRDWLLRSTTLHRIVARFFDSRFSSLLIDRFIIETDANIEEASAPSTSYQTFNDFFSRQLQKGCRPIDARSHIMVSPCDGKLHLAERTMPDQRFEVKGIKFCILDLLGKSEHDHCFYNNADIAVFRLYLADYHRFHFPCSGIIIDHYKIHGDYYSVSPFPGNSINFYSKNARTVTVIDTLSHGLITLVAVGGFLISSIQHSHLPWQKGSSVKKGEEAGLFQFGGSTLVVITENHHYEYEGDLINNSQLGLETHVKTGSAIAKQYTRDQDNLKNLTTPYEAIHD